MFGVLSLGADNVTTNAYVLTIRPSGSVLRTSGHVAGNLRKYVPTGTGVDQTFEIGSGADYTPVDLGFADVSAGGYVQAATTAGDHPDLSTSAILPAKSANRYWTVHNQGATFTTANATLHFVPGDLDAGADPAAFVVQKFDSPSWSSPVTGVRTATSTEATGLTSFSDFAVGESHTVTLTYTAGSGGTISGTSPQTVIFGGDGTEVTAVPNSGYHFVDWSDAVATAARTDMHVTADVNVTANFAIDTYALTTTVVGSGSVDRSPNSPSYDQGTVVHLTATPAPGWTFVGWSGDASGSTNPLDVTMDAAKSITATFAINMYTLTTDVAPPGSGSVLRDPDQASFNHGSSVELTASPATGYHFVDWSGDLTGSTNPQVLTMNAAKSVTANFAINSYALTTTVVGNGSVSRSLDQPSYEHGTVVHLSATPDPGWMFVGWSGDASGSANPLDVTMDAAKSITATFALTTYTLTTDVAPTGGGTINRDQPGPNYTPGSVVQVTAVPATGYHFDSWSGALAGSANPQSVTLDGNKTVTANFVLGGNSITITTDGNGAGSVTRSPNYVLYAPGSMVTLTAVPEYGSTFTGWSGDLSGTTNPQTLTLDADKNVNATFVHNSYVLTLLADAASGGGVARNPDIPLYGPGEVVTLTAQPLEGWEFRSWCGDTSGTDSPLDLVMTGDETVVAILNEIGSPNVHVVFPNGSDNLEVGTVC
ncbi:MAG: InlB B-repeat-containing protein, partial [Candidatus Eiseniibacteriota bacterium]